MGFVMWCKAGKERVKTNNGIKLDKIKKRAQYFTRLKPLASGIFLALFQSQKYPWEENGLSEVLETKNKNKQTNKKKSYFNDDQALAEGTEREHQYINKKESIEYTSIFHFWF